MKKEAIRNLIVAGAITATAAFGGAKEAEASSITSPTNTYDRTAMTLLIASEITAVTALSYRFTDGYKLDIEKTGWQTVAGTNLLGMSMVLGRVWGVV